MGVTVQQCSLEIGSTWADALPILQSAWESVDNSPSSSNIDKEPSSKICRPFASGYTCKRASRNGGCPDVHDLDKRKEALQTLRLVKEKRLVQTRLSAEKESELESGKKIQGHRDMVATKLKLLRSEAGSFEPKSPSVSLESASDKGNSSNAGQAQLNTHPTCGNVTSSKPVKPTSNKTAFPMVKPRSSKSPARPKTSRELDKGDSSSPKCRSSDLIYRSVVVQLDSTKGPNSFCQHFLKPTGCKFGNYCRFVHDSALRLAYRKQRRSKQNDAQKETVFTRPVGNNNKQSGVEYDDTESLPKPSTDATPADDLKDFKATKTYSQVAGTNMMEKSQGPSAKDIDVKEKWDHGELAKWAARNISSNQVNKHLIPHLNAGNNPIDFLNKRYRKFTGKSIFHYFGQLPGEIRNQIWDLVLDVETYDQRLTYRREYKKDGNIYPARLLPQSITPRLLHVNMESRSRAQLRYEWVFASESYSSMAWFNFEKDTLLLHTAYSAEFTLMIKLLTKPDRDRVLRLKLPLRDYLFKKEEVLSAIIKFKNLKRLKLMVGDSKEDRPYSTNHGLIIQAQGSLRVPWKQSHPNRRTPVVTMDVIDALRAHVMGIDGLRWN